MRKRGAILALGLAIAVTVLYGCGNEGASSTASGTAAQTETSAISETTIAQTTETATITTTAMAMTTTAAITTTATPRTTKQTESEAESEMTMQVEVGGSVFLATLEKNAAVDALLEMLQSGDVVLQLHEYGGFEKVGALGQSLPIDNRQLTTKAGDIVLYQGNQIVLFYGSNSWSYTPIGHIEDLDGWAEALGRGDVTVRFSLEE